MRARSLQLRLLFAAGATIFVALALAWFAMTLLFTRHIERRVADELTRAGIELIADLGIAADGRPEIEDGPADPRFERPASGLYWQVSTPAGHAQSRSLWDAELPLPATSSARTWASRVAAGPFERQIFLLERSVLPEGGNEPTLVQVGLDVREIGTARSEFGRDLGLFLGLLWLVLVAAAWLQVRLGLRPLARVRREIVELEANARARLGHEHPREVMPLVSAINRLAETRERDLVRARRRAADLAHSLKTPLAALGAQTRRIRAAGAGEAADGLERVIAAATAAVEAELARTRVAGVAGQSGICAPLQVAEQVIGVLERTEFGERLVFETQIDEALRLPVAAEDLTEILGALVENAARFALRRVRVAGAEASDRSIRLDIEDDGHGLDISIEQALLRGGRVDEARQHQGLGLAIARDLVEATGGRLELGTSELGGLHVHLAWPPRGTPVPA